MALEDMNEPFALSLKLSQRRAHEKMLLEDLASVTSTMHSDINAKEMAQAKKLQMFRDLAAHETSLIKEWQQWGIKVCILIDSLLFYTLHRMN